MGSNMTSSTRKLRAALLLKAITEREIAVQIGVSQSSISRTIRGERRNARLRIRISRLLGVSIDVWRDLDAELKTQEVKKQ